MNRFCRNSGTREFGEKTQPTYSGGAGFLGRIVKMLNCKKQHKHTDETDLKKKWFIIHDFTIPKKRTSPFPLTQWKKKEGTSALCSYRNKVSCCNHKVAIILLKHSSLSFFSFLSVYLPKLMPLLCLDNDKPLIQEEVKPLEWPLCIKLHSQGCMRTIHVRKNNYSSIQLQLISASIRNWLIFFS